MATQCDDILAKAVAGERLSVADGLVLLQSHDLAALGRAADAVARRIHPEPFRTYNVDRNINYTNVCTSGCGFCAFSRKAGDADAYVISPDELYRKIEETVALGGNQILLQGGMHPELKIEWCEELLRGIKQRFPQINVHGFSPPEIDHIAALSGLSARARILDDIQVVRAGSDSRRVAMREAGKLPGRTFPRRQSR